MYQTQLVVSVIAVAILIFAFDEVSADPLHSVNAVIGDVSFVEKYGRHPDGSTDETLRIQVHLEYVERMLRQADCHQLSPEQQKRRKHMLDLLQEYRIAARFPRNFEYAGVRVPCFIDAEGRICAVGYLVEQTAGRDVAEEINGRHQYDNIADMGSGTVERWIAWSGLTENECAMIQPAYGYQRDANNYVEPWYGLTTSILSAGSLSLSTINAIQMTREERKKVVPFVGVVVGASQLILGAFMFPEDNVTTYSNESEKVLSMVNIGLGTTAVILSFWNLATIPQTEKVSWNFYPLPSQNGKIGLGLNLTARL